MTGPDPAGLPHERRLGRRDFLLATLASAATAAAGCKGDRAARSTTTTAPVTSTVPGSSSDLGGTVPDADTMMGWIEQIFGRGIRRPGYPADTWTEEFVADRFREIGLDDVRSEPVAATRWTPHQWSLTATPEGGDPVELGCFPLPYAVPTEGIDVELVPFDPARPAAVVAKAALVDAPVVRLPPAVIAGFGSAPKDLTGRIYDPDHTFDTGEHVLPHTAQRNRIADPVVAAGAAAFIGTLLDHPGNSYDYFVPYHGEPVPIPGVWISGTDGEWLHRQLAERPVRVRLRVEASSEPCTTHNIIGDLSGPGDDHVLVGSHHDGPWASAVEDASGTALVLAQASYWASVAPADRPHCLRFVLHGGHMCGGAGHDAYVEAHRAELDRIVVEVHLEHAALDVADQDGDLVATGLCVPRWFFTSRIPALETSVARAIEAEDLRRSMLVAPDALGKNPPTDGAHFHQAGVPVVQLLAAPWYLFDEADRLDKVDRGNLVAITRTAIRIIESTRSTSAAQLRTGLVAAGP